MKITDLNPQLRSTFRFMPNMPVRNALGRSFVRSALRLLPGPKVPAGMSFERLDFPEGGGVRVFTPTERTTDAALVYLHGGGMVIGNAAQEDAHLIDLAQKLGIVTVSVEYRLAPEHPYPAPLEDCLRAWDWLQTGAAAKGIDPGRIVVGGQSAGGGLAAGLTLRLHDREGVQPVAQWLFCPMLDDRTAARNELDAVGNYLWNNKSNRYGWTAYLGTTPGASNISEYAAPSRRESLEGLPPTWIGTGSAELFFEEDRAYADALKGAGVETTLDIVEGAPHAFESVAAKTPLAQAYTNRAETWLRERIA